MADQQFYTIVTTAGKAKIANATAFGTKVNFATLKAGDGNGTYYEPTEAQIDLVHTVWSGPITNISTDPNNPNWIIVAVSVPANVGGFMIREVGIFDDTGTMIAIGKYPETYKPTSDTGSTKDLTIRTILEVSNAGTIELNVDPNVILATKKDIEDINSKIVTDENAVNNLQTDVLESTGFGVVSGLTVSAQTSPNMTVNVSSGIVHMPSGIRLAPSGNSALAITAADATNPRVDIIYVKNDSTIGYLAGIPAVTPTAPDIPTGAFLLYQINVPAGATSITNDNIMDKRKMKITSEYLDNTINQHKADITNPHKVTASQVGLGNVEKELASVQTDIIDLAFQLAIQNLVSTSNMKHVFIDKIENASDVNLISGMYANSKVYI